jgi:hypothetical protein
VTLNPGETTPTATSFARNEIVSNSPSLSDNPSAQDAPTPAAITGGQNEGVLQGSTSQTVNLDAGQVAVSPPGATFSVANGATTGSAVITSTITAASAEAQAAAAEARMAARQLHEQGVSLRDVSEVLGVSRQRAHRLVS